MEKRPGVENAYAVCNAMKSKGTGFFASENPDEQTIQKAILEYNEDLKKAEAVVRNHADTGPDFHPETFGLNDVEIFEAGTWNGFEYGEKDLDGIVAAFNAGAKEIKPFVKLGHDQGQKLLQKDGYPSAGWITGLRRVGSKLLADIQAMPKAIKELVENKAYGRLSSELYVKPKIGEKVYDYALKAVALLGGDTPAVKTLKDFVTLYTDETPEGAGVLSFAAEAKAEGTVFLDHSEENDMGDQDKAQADAKVKDLERQLSEQKLEIVRLEKQGAKAKRREDLEKLFAEAKDKVTPALRPAIEAIAFSDLTEADAKGVRTFSWQDGKDEKVLTFTSGLDLAKSLLGSLPDTGLGGGNVSRHTERVKAPSTRNAEADDAEMAAKVEVFIEKHPDYSYRDAVLAVASMAGKER